MKNLFTHLKLWCLTTLFISYSFFYSKLQAQCDPVSDSLALVAFYNSTGGDNWMDNSNWLVTGQSIENWYGVTVNTEGCVYRLILYGNLTGVIPPEIGNLSQLTQLYLTNSHLTGEIPPEIGNLSNLSLLNLSNNELVSIPSEIGNLTYLTSLELSNNPFSGNIPPEIGNLSNLTELTIKNTELTGNIPPEIGNMSSLISLKIQSNNLSGNIPPELGNLTNLKELVLFNINLSGNIPPELGNLTNLKELVLFNTNLSGEIPPEIGNMSSLTKIDINNNQISGNIPPEIGNLINLIQLDLGFNQFTGSIPPEIGNLTNLFVLVLRGNQLTGNIPIEVFHLFNLEFLILRDNQLTGIISPEIENLTNLRLLLLWNNNLEGSILPLLCNLLYLENIDLSNNNFLGPIPHEIKNLINLKRLRLGSNHLTGNIPSEIGNLVNLQQLNLRENNLTGNIPPEIGNLVNLIYGFDLSNNQITGKLPIELSNLINLGYGDISNNQLYGCFPPQYSIFCNPNDNSLDFTGNPGLSNGGDFDAFCSNNSGACNPTILGKIILDENLNCLSDSLELGLQNWMIKANSPNGNLFSISDINGHYGILTHPESYSVELISAPGPYWEENCTGIQNVIVEDSLSLDTLNFFPNAIALCPYMTVDISTPLLRRCFDNTFKVEYCNYGTENAEAAFIKVNLNSLITVNSASIPINEQVGNTFTFELGDVGIGECGYFYIYTNVSCNTELGQTLCATAKIYPDSLCAGVPPEWSGATVGVEGICDGDEVVFTLSNTGESDMQVEQTYVIIEDGVIITPIPVPFLLNSGEAIEVNLEANGSTYICQATQVPYHPLENMPSAFVEACGTNGQGEFSTGYVTQYPEDDISPFISIDCQEVIGSFDPNDKRGFPEGYGESHYIERGQDIEYLIRFQNTGTDTAFTVIVEDVLSPHLEMTSLRLGASSHPYSIDILGSDTLKFIFESILLVDSTANEPASHGFLKFKISQKVDLPLGTIIENEAAIIFDFNDPVITNTTFHTIGENFIEVGVNQLPYIPGLKVSVTPNPVTTEAMIRITGIGFQEAEFRLFNVMGVEVKRATFSGHAFVLKKSDLPEGLYVFEVLVDGMIGGVGKLVVE